jgi:3-dehydroquinate synthase
MPASNAPSADALPALPPPVRVDLGPARSYAIRFRPLAEVPALLDGAGLRTGRCLVVTDENVAAHYRTPLAAALEKAGWTPRVVVVPPGEASKSAERLHALYDEALAWGVDRQTPVVALGGGVVGDLAGFAAATLLRGLPLVQLPTSLIAQVDSAVGGKTGINHAAGKNLLGAFYQPRVVVTDPATLVTLPQREWTSGMAEVVKHALIADPALLAFLEDHWGDLMLRRDDDAVAEMVARAVQVKAGIVAEDEREAGRRALLNFGHTVAHAVEKVAGYGTFTHGEAVAVGMRAALALSRRRHPDLDAARADALVASIPVEGDPATLDFEAMLDAMRADKKAVAGRPRFVLLDRLGHAYVTADVERAELEAAWAAATAA